jgi:hypothetical protein
MRFGESIALPPNDQGTREVELHGVIQKKNSKGFFQNRYFRTAGVLLNYYTDYESYVADACTPSASYRFTDVGDIEILGDHRFLVSFSSGTSFKLELRAATEAQCEQWVTFLKAKKNLYSVYEVILYMNLC